MWKETRTTRSSFEKALHTARLFTGVVRSLVVELWLHRVTDDLSGLTFQEWDPSVGTDDTRAPVVMFVNSSELCTTDFHLTEVRPLQDQVICLFAGLIPNPDMPLSLRRLD